MLESKQISEFPGKQPSEELHYFDAAGRPFADFFVRPDTCTLVWPGIINVSELEREALSIVPRLVGLPPMTEPDTRNRERLQLAHVSLLLEPGALREFDLLNGDEFSQCEHLLSHAGNISFARFDMATAPTRPLADRAIYALTVTHNSAVENNRKPDQLTLTLDRAHFWGPRLLQWILSHHMTTASQEEGDIDSGAAEVHVDELGRVITALSQ